MVVGVYARYYKRKSENKETEKYKQLTHDAIQRTKNNNEIHQLDSNAIDDRLHQDYRD